MINKITVTVEFTLQPATGPNLGSQLLEVLDADGDRYDYVNTEAEGVAAVRKIMGRAALYTIEIDVDGRVQ